MEDKNYSAVPPPPSLTDNGSTVNFSDALSRARAIAEKLKQTPTPGPAASPVEPPAAGIKRGHEDSSSSSFSSPNDRENKRGAYDVGASRPAYTSSEPRRYGLGSEERRGTSTYGAASGRQEEYSVPNHMVGLLIGKGGENLKKIERVSGVSKVQFAADTSGPERVVFIVGEQEQISIARDMIRQMVDDAKANEANRTTGPPGGGYHYQGNMHSNSIQVRIPVPKIGLVIGRGGETIREFEQQSRAKIILPSDSAGDINNERAVTLIGDEAAVQHAKQLIEDIVFGSPNLATPRYSQYGASHGMGVGGGPNDQRIYVPIPATVVGLIIGRGGETIRYFQEQSGARVKVDLSGDPNAEERNVCITGEPQALAVAKRLVEEKVAEANPEYAARYSSPDYTSFYEQQFQQYDYSQYYAQYGYDQYQAYAQYNYGGYQPGTATPAPAPGTTPESTPAVANTPASTTETDNNSDQKSTAEAAAAYYAHYYGQPQTQEQKDAYNQWFQQYYGQYYNQQSDSQERANPSLTEADQEETKADEKTDKNSQSEEDDKKDDSQSENQDENENENEEEAGDSE